MFNVILTEGMPYNLLLLRHPMLAAGIDNDDSINIEQVGHDYFNLYQFYNDLDFDHLHFLSLIMFTLILII